MVGDDFFDKGRCDRCHGELFGRTTSWFNTDTICIDCSRIEDEIIEARDESRSDLENWGTIPDVDFKYTWGEYEA